MTLDFSNIPNKDFNLNTCSEMYDDHLAEFQEQPDEILISNYQKLFLIPRDPFNAETTTWRGVPLKVKDD
jgi:hypothetical protein